MRTCPYCFSRFNDPTLNFCLEDGTVLVRGLLNKPYEPYLTSFKKKLFPPRIPKSVLWNQGATYYRPAPKPVVIPVPVKTPIVPLSDFLKKYRKDKLQQIVRAYLYLFDGLPEPTIDISESPHPSHPLAVAWATNDYAISIYEAYFNGRCKGQFTYHDLHDTVKHELTHNWVYYFQLKQAFPHGAVFQEKFASIKDRKPDRKFWTEDLT